MPKESRRPWPSASPPGDDRRRAPGHVTAVVGALERSGRLRLALVTYGLAVALVGTAAWVVAFPDSSVALQGSRQSGIAGSISVLDKGGPPLVVRHGATYQPANEGDDLGIYLALGELGHLVGAHDAVFLFKAFAASAMGMLVALAPLVAYLLFDSVFLALLAPLGILASFPFLTNRDVYFVSAWIVLFGLPLAYLVLERGWSRRLALPLLAVGAVAASCSNAIRAHSGTGVALALVAAAFLRESAWRWRLAGVALVAACYAAVSPLAISAIQSHSFAEVHIRTRGNASAHSLWHPTYLGLGYLPNGWGIRWSDRVGEETVHAIDPNAAYLSPRYEQILRHRYFTIVEHHPFWTLRLYAVKAAALIWDSAKHGGILALLLPAALLLGRRRDLLRRRLLLLAPAAVIAAVPPLLTIPSGYDSGMIACLDLAGALAVGSLAGAQLVGPRTRAALVSAALLAGTVASAVTTHVFAAQVARQIGG